MPKAKSGADREPQLLEIVARYANEDKARETFERLRWPGEFPGCVICPRCGVQGESHRVTSAKGSTTRKGLWYCTACKGQYTVTVGTVIEDSHIPISKWLTTFHLLASSKKGMSAHQIHRLLGITYKSAWFLCHRIRAAMTQEPMVALFQGVVEADETFVGGRPENMHAHRRMPAPAKTVVLSLVERGGDVRSRVVPNVSGETLRAAIRATVGRKARIMTDGHKSYVGLAKEYAGHESVNHQAGEYVRGLVHTNSVEGYFSILKRGITGVYHHVSAKHLPRYLGEFDMRYNNRSSRGIQDGERAARAIKGAVGKRLTYRPLVAKAAKAAQ